MTNAQCTTCKEIEPQDHDSQVDGLWLCPCKTPIKKIDGKKPIDAFFDELGDTNE